MRKHFLILMLFALLPLAGWAANLETNGTLKALSPYYGQDIPAVQVFFGSSETPLSPTTDYVFNGYFTDPECTAEITVAAIKAAPAERTYYVKVTGINAYEGVLTASFQVKKMPLKLKGTQDGTAKHKTYGAADPENIATGLYAMTNVKNVSDTEVTGTFTGKITFVREGGEDADHYDIIATITDEDLAQNYTILSKDITTDWTHQAVFTIDPKDFSTATDITVDPIAAVTFKGSEYTPAPIVKDGTKVLEADDVTTHAKDYTVGYSHNLHYGTATVTVTGTNNYIGTKNVTFTINKAPVLVRPSATKVYDGTNDIANLTYIYQGFVDATTADDITPTATPTAAGLPTKTEEAGMAGEYVLTINSGASFAQVSGEEDYSFTFEPGLFTITQKQFKTTIANVLNQPYGATEIFSASSVSALTGDALPTTPQINTGTEAHDKLLKLAVKGLKTEKAADNTDTSYDYDLVPALRTPAEVKAAVAAAGYTASTTPKAEDVEKYVNALAKSYEINLTESTNGKLKYANGSLSVALNESFFTDFYKDNKLQKVYDGEEIAISLEGVDKSKALKVIGPKDANVVLDNVVLTVEDNSANVKRDGTDPDIILPYRLVLSGAVAEHYDVTHIPSSFYIQPRPIQLTIPEQKFQTGTVPSVAQNYTFETIMVGETPAAKQGVAPTDNEKDVFVLGFAGDGDTDGYVKFNSTTGVITTDATTVFENGKGIIAVDPETEGSVFANYDFTYTEGSGKVTIIAAETYALDEEDDLTDLGNHAGVTVILVSDRQIKKNVWASMVLPFNTTVRKVSEALGYAVVDKFIADESSEDMNFKIHMGEIPAYTPFLVKTDATINLNAVKFVGVDLVALTDANRGNLTQSNKNYNFIGNMKNGTVGAIHWTDGSSMAEDNIQFNKYRATHVMPALKAYITANEGVTAAPNIFIEEPDGTTTAISAITAEGDAVAKEGWFTLNGMRLEGAPTEKGVYINNGKKVVIK